MDTSTPLFREEFAGVGYVFSARAMKRKKQSGNHKGSSGFDQLATHSDFYTGSPTERPLYSERPESDPNRVRKTARHQAVTGRRKEPVDAREKAALIAILKAAITLVFLCILFFMLWKGIKIYEESVWMENQPAEELAPVLKEVTLVEDFDISAADAAQTFADRIEMWKKTERLVRSVGDLLLRNNFDQAIERCQQVLSLDPAHIGALKYLGELYFDKGMYVEAINTYIRLLSVDPSRTDFQLALLKSLDAHGDAESTIAVAQWYQDGNVYNEDVQRYMAKAYFTLEKYEEAAGAYERVLKDSPRNVEALENQAVSYMRLEQFDKALPPLEKLVVVKLRDPICYKRIAICNAQLGRGEETVQVMGKSAHLFGADTVAMWIQDPMMDPVRFDRSFQMYADSVVTEEYRKYLERMAQAMESKPKEQIGPRLELPDTDKNMIDPELLRQGQPAQ